MPAYSHLLALDRRAARLSQCLVRSQAPAAKIAHGLKQLAALRRISGAGSCAYDVLATCRNYRLRHPPVWLPQ